ncbi:ABC transporter permease [Cereibacter changlensis]|uniref:ABC transporter permease n=1 Tax=Cereibacter changlensis TaxID=402884 RepID=A0A4U0YYU9_9RHOB|nr:ABC transporter permease [Cereibacter changlensis]TKA97065.1 ABC transporter permease [Cereibacter changlensis]
MSHSSTSPGNAMHRFVLPIGVHVAAIALWQIGADYGGLPKYLLPSPWEMVQTLGQPRNQWLANTWVTTVEIFGGFLLAAVIGVGLALLFSWSRAATSALMPLLVSLNMIPKVALGPIIIVWLSYGINTNMLIAFAISFFPIVITTSRGLAEIEPEMLYLARTLNASRWQIFRKIQFPGALPYIFSGMKVAAVLAVAGAIVGEFIGSDRGLGYLMIQVQVNLDTATMFMAVIIITLIGVVIYGAVALLEWLLVNRRGAA